MTLLLPRLGHHVKVKIYADNSAMTKLWDISRGFASWPWNKFQQDSEVDRIVGRARYDIMQAGVENMGVYLITLIYNTSS